MRRPRPPRTRVAVLGGTFDRLHLGHEALLRAAFRSAGEVRIGLATASYLERHPKRNPARIQSYQTRLRRLRAYLTRCFPRRVYHILPLRDVFGGSIRPGIDVLVLSAGTRSGGRRVNAERHRRGLPPLRVLEVPLVRAEDGRPISSTRIRAGQIDGDGIVLGRRPSAASEGRVSRPRPRRTRSRPSVR